MVCMWSTCEYDYFILSNFIMIGQSWLELCSNSYPTIEEIIFFQSLNRKGNYKLKKIIELQVLKVRDAYYQGCPPPLDPSPILAAVSSNPSLT